MQLVLGPRLIASSRDLARILREGKAGKQTRGNCDALVAGSFPVRLSPTEFVTGAPCLFDEEADDCSHG